MQDQSHPLVKAIENLCKLSNRTFKASTSYGELTIVISGEEHITSKDEYDIDKKVEIIKEDGTLLSAINYTDSFSAYYNGGGTYLSETIACAPDELHPFGYLIIYNYLNCGQAVIFELNGTKYHIEENIIFERNKPYTIKDNVVKIALDVDYRLEVNVGNGQYIMYFKSIFPPVEETQLSNEEAKKVIEKLGIDLNTKIEDAKNLFDLYKQNSHLLDIRTSDEILVSILISANKKGRLI